MAPFAESHLAWMLSSNTLGEGNAFAMDGWGLIITGIGTLGTVVLAITALWQGQRIKDQDARLDEQAERIEKQIALGNRQADSAEASAKSANVLYQEAVRSRIDQGAPEIAVFLEHPSPPLVDRHRPGLLQGNEAGLLTPDSIERSQPALGETFVFDEQRSNFLWFRGRGLLVNEGRTSARVRVSPEGRFIEGKSDLTRGEPVQLPAVEGRGKNAIAILPPGARALFEWADGLTVSDWTKAQENRNSKVGSLWLWITVFDTRENGVIDTQVMHFRPEVLDAVPGRRGHWTVPPERDFGPLNPLPRLRRYRHEGATHEDLSQRDENLAQRDP